MPGRLTRSDAAKRAAERGSVTITDHGRRSHVLLTAEEFDRISGERELVGDRLWARGTEHIELDLPERRVETPRGLDL
ncbi:type II toxin-antitoxin system prevent-host-death family antitoxin [Galbitalea sp. SE-J8]|uniref:type II toxin-antitoxin system prevent-host-death family antitoxin n=1 Tax=Galbitalea sp. SE-J8 TaxID=3054952 RepID=UPI00259CF951|nr:type II toxin-antitoxin system prevent-host-death family antitoxin [Galbitalea sp. SE-J8]MDM4764427.1 type II toxin-antitoxin system prevent-host-death family antitoxin [Galbitalea sp. SE-J8]